MLKGDITEYCQSMTADGRISQYMHQIKYFNWFMIGINKKIYHLLYFYLTSKLDSM